MRFSWLALPFALAIFIVLSCFQVTSSLAATHSNEVAQDTELLIPNSYLIAQSQTEEFILPSLPYDYDALDTYIDTQTMMLHHDKHHAGYVRNLNAAIDKHPELKGKSVEELLRDLDSIPDDIRTTVRNNGGGHANHTMFWEIMTPNGQGQPTGAIARAIDDTFGDFGSFKQEFNAAGKGRFGSGWAWLVLTKDGELKITNTLNQDSPFLEGSYPVMGNDVWEHAYYLKYQNRRGDYLDAWWNVVNWEKVNERFEQAQS
ncbi:superoxide dismutase [Synechococcus sp. PCC 7336]|uniref:superoxide dismutase n=1 Tax=Synechococcus sp. PCC 7336 TaxID=195250 RepID=UPI00034DA0A5